MSNKFKKLRRPLVRRVGDLVVTITPAGEITLRRYRCRKRLRTTLAALAATAERLEGRDQVPEGQSLLELAGRAVFNRLHGGASNGQETRQNAAAD